uniref:Uncharacterized protein n=1 Tax=Arundo donax TaxID=35708 RepID=A0A0A9AIJ3_ARUDO
MEVCVARITPSVLRSGVGSWLASLILLLFVPYFCTCYYSRWLLSYSDVLLVLCP